MEITGKNYISIKVSGNYIYDCHITKIGEPNDNPSGFSAWSWVNHLKGKNWFGGSMESEFMYLARKICNK